MVERLLGSNLQAQSGSALERLLQQKSLAENVKDFITDRKVRGLSPATIQAYRSRLVPFLKYCDGIVLSATIDCTANHIRGFLEERQKTNGPESIYDIYRSLFAFFNWIVNEGGLSRSPMATMKTPKVPRKIVEPLTKEQIAELLLATEGSRFADFRNRAVILTFLDTAVRLDEMAGMRYKDINLDTGIIKVFGKGAKERFVRISRETRKAFLKYDYPLDKNRAQAWLTEEFKPITKSGVRQIVVRMFKQAGITEGKRGPHILRALYHKCHLYQKSDSCIKSLNLRPHCVCEFN